MNIHQLAPINNKDLFEDLVCDLFNILEDTNSFKKFGKNGHLQKGIDIFSSDKNIVIQCKKKDLSRKPTLLKNELCKDIQNDVSKTISENLKIKFNKIIFTSTFRDHPDIDEFCESLMDKKHLGFKISYWGWDTIENHILNSQELIEKYYNNFVITTSNKETEIKRNLELKRRIRIDFSDWLNYSIENRKVNSKILLRDFQGNQYPNTNNPDKFGEYSWYSVELKGLYHSGMEFIYGIELLKIHDNNKWEISKKTNPDDKTFVKAMKIGQVNFSDIVEYDLNGDEHYNFPHIFCKFRYKGLPFENTYFQSLDYPVPYYFEYKDKIGSLK